MKNIINNYQDYADKYEYIVARACNYELWFYGAYSDKDKAYEAAKEVDGVVLKK